MRTITVTHEIDCEAEYCGKCKYNWLNFCQVFHKQLNLVPFDDGYKYTSKLKRLPQCIKAEANSQVKLDSSNIRS